MRDEREMAIQHGQSRHARDVVEDVIGLDGLWASLFVPENEVDPVVDVLGHVVALERLSALPHKVVGRRRPRRQLDIAHLRAAIVNGDRDTEYNDKDEP